MVVLECAPSALQRSPSACELNGHGGPLPGMGDMIATKDSEKLHGESRRCLRVAKSSLPYVRDLVLILSAAAAVAVVRYFGPVGNGFFCHDPSISYPYRGDSVTVTTLALLTVLLPPLIMLPIELALERGGLTWSLRRPLWTVAVLYGRHATCQAFLFSVIEVVKNLVSKPRPSFMDVCRPTAYNETLCNTTAFISDFHCSSVTSGLFTQRQVVDAMLSFPSGHAAISCCTATFMAMYLLSRCGCRRRSVLRAWIAFCSVLYGAVISFSRVADHRHHLVDVLAGAGMGVAAGALLCYGVCQSMFSQTLRRKALLPQSSVASNRTTDTQVTNLEDEF